MEGISVLCEVEFGGGEASTPRTNERTAAVSEVFDGVPAVKTAFDEAAQSVIRTMKQDSLRRFVGTSVCISRKHTNAHIHLIIRSIAYPQPPRRARTAHTHYIYRYIY